MLVLRKKTIQKGSCVPYRKSISRPTANNYYDVKEKERVPKFYLIARCAFASLDS